MVSKALVTLAACSRHKHCTVPCFLRVGTLEFLKLSDKVGSLCIA